MELQLRLLQGFGIYFVIINLIGFVIMKIDKEKAKRNAWRIPEKTLFGIAILFGSVGISMGMKRFRHKTKHRSFVIGIPLIEALQVLLVAFIVWKLRGI